MANTWINVEDVKPYADLYLRNKSITAGLSAREITSNFEAVVGDTVKAKIPPELTANEFVDGTDTVSAQDITATSVDVKIEKHFETSFKINSKEMLLNLEDLMRDGVAPAIRANLRALEDYNIEKLTGGFAANVSGTPGTNMSTRAHVAAAEKILFDNGGFTTDLIGLINSTTYSSIKQIAINNSTDNTPEAYSNLAQGNISQMDNVTFARTQAAGTFDRGDIAGTVLVNGAVAAGLTAVPVDALTAATGTIKEGARMTFAGDAQVYTVIDDATIAGNAATLNIFPALAIALDGEEAVTFQSAVTDSVIYHPSAFASAILAPVVTGPEEIIIDAGNGVKMRLIANGLNTGLVKVWTLDFFVGSRVVNRNYGVIGQG